MTNYSSSRSDAIAYYVKRPCCALAWSLKCLGQSSWRNISLNLERLDGCQISYLRAFRQTSNFEPSIRWLSVIAQLRLSFRVG